MTDATLSASPATDRRLRLMRNDVRTFIARGAIGGLIGGICAGLFQWLVTEKPIRAALAVEDALSTSNEPPMFTRGTQVIGGMTAVAIFSIFLGVVFGVVVAAFWHKLPSGTDFGRAIRVAGAAFFSLALIPASKYPANLPAVGDPNTINDRSIAYLTLMVASVALTYGAWWLWQRLAELSPATRFAVTAGTYLLVLTLIFVVWPATKDPIQNPAVVGGHLAERIVSASVVWRFRLFSLFENLLSWTVTGVVFGLLCERATAKSEAGAQTGELASATR